MKCNRQVPLRKIYEQAIGLLVSKQGSYSLKELAAVCYVLNLHSPGKRYALSSWGQYVERQAEAEKARVMREK